MDKIRNVPEIRFNNFDSNWAIQPFGSIAERSSIKSSESILPRIEFEDIISGEGQLKRNVKQKSNKHKTGILFEEGEVLYGKLRPYLKNWYYANFRGVAVGDFWVLKALDNYSSKFIYYLIQTQKYSTVANTSIGSKMPRADWKLVSNAQFFVPNINEQENIGYFFKNLDEKLEIEKAKHQKLINFKKAMLEDMFPKEGESKPKIRFDGFDDQWVKASVSDTLNYEQPWRYIVNSDDYKSSGIPVLTANKAFILGYTNENRAYRKGECIIFDDFTMDFKYVNFNFMVKSSALKILTTKSSNLYFIYSMLKNLNLTPESHKRHYISQIQPLEIKIPSLEEQETIGEFFKGLDDKINLVLKRIEKIENFKKSMMDKMFV